MGRVHTEAIRRLGNVEVVALASLEEDVAQRMAAQFSVGRVERDYRKVLEDPAIDAVHICTPNAQHFPMAQEAMQAGKHVVCEKPLATTVEEARTLVAAAAPDRAPQLPEPQPSLLSVGAADSADVGGGRTGRDPGGAGHVFAGLAAVRHGL